MENSLSSSDYIDVEKYKEYLEVSPNDVRCVASLGSALINYIGEFLDDLYLWIKKFPEYSAFLNDPSRVDNLKEGQFDYWKKFFLGKIDEEFVEDRVRKAAKQHAIGLPILAVYATMNFAREWFLNKIRELPLIKEDAVQLSCALRKIMFFDICISVETYHLIEKGNRDTDIENIIENLNFLYSESTSKSKDLDQPIENIFNHVKDTLKKLESETELRKKIEQTLERADNKLLEAMKKSGMAEVATTILHNTGNALSSISVASDEMRSKLQNSKINLFIEANQKLIDLCSLSDIPKNKQKEFELLQQYSSKVSSSILAVQDEILNGLNIISDYIHHIKITIHTQQKYAKLTHFMDEVNANEVIEDAIKLNIFDLQNQNITIEFDPGELPAVYLDKHMLIEVLSNLLGNAKQAILASNQKQKLIQIKTKAKNQDFIEISVTDSGIGMNEDILNKIFTFGFTTKKDGHGFGLNGSYKVIKKIGGDILVTSRGLNKGATFKILLPIHKPEERMPSECVL